MSRASKSGIQTTADGSSFVPASKRADGSTRREIRVRPGYKPPEDVETYKNKSTEAWKSRGSGLIPGADLPSQPADAEIKSKNAKRREAARRKAASETVDDADLTKAMEQTTLDSESSQLKEDGRQPSNLAICPSKGEDEDRQKQIRNALKKLKAVRELKEKKACGEKLSPDQLVKVGKEDELVRDLQKLEYDGPEIAQDGG